MGTGVPILIEATVTISIIDESNRRDCDAGCGVDWSSPDAVALATRQIRDRFGNKARLQYLDLASSTDDRQANEWRGVIRERSLSVPLLFINGRLRIGGQFDIRQIIDAIEAEMEIGT